LKQIRRKIYIPVIVVIAIIGIFPIDIGSAFGFAANDLRFLLPLTYLYLLITTEAEIFSILYLGRIKSWRDRKSNKPKPTKTGFKHRFIDLGVPGMFIFTVLPFTGLIAIIIFTKKYRSYSKGERIISRVVMYLGYIVRIVWLGEIGVPIVNFLKNLIKQIFN
jgi:hypothetical protein